MSNLFAAPSWLWKYHLWPTSKWIFCKKLESVLYGSALAITWAIQGTSGKKSYQELELESLKSKRRYRRLSCMFKIMKEEALHYLIKWIPTVKQTIITRSNHMPIYSCRTSFQVFFSPSMLNDWCNLDDNIRNPEPISIFKSKLLSFTHPVKNNIYNILAQRDLNF